MRSILHSKNTYLPPPSIDHFPFPNQEKHISSNSSNKENFPSGHFYSESTTEEYHSKENSDFDDFEDLFNKQPKMKLENKPSDDLSKKILVDETKYKTEMCKNWEEKGRCNYGKKCKFAHGKHELVDKNFINKDRYKSKLCNSFHSSFFCPYGQRCLFIHSQPKKIEEALNQTQHYRRQLNMMQFASLLNCKEGKRCDLFIKIRNENQKKLEIITENFCRKLVDED